ncbi:hypothetical protein EG329_001821 [Mollisiaceae sp. DMI_Dod_QoI]|nr:hypothetical protein EG329_001821 [Helotiales sp. DMI_Dod_QoI]
MWLPTTIIAASSAQLATGVSSSAPTGVPTNLPKVISNPNATVAPPETTLIQVGFLYPLNYDFVVGNPLSSAQIFQYLPEGIANGLGLNPNMVVMKSLIPMDTTQQLGFITTLAQMYIPSNMVSTLSLDLHIPTAAIYNNEDQSVNTLVNYINPAIPILSGSTLGTTGASGTGSGSAATSSSASSNNNNVFDPQTGTTSTKVSGTTAGIALAAIGGSAAYGVAMFLVARRYKRRKQSHRRSSSVTNPSEMRQSGSPALMGGAGAFMSGGRTSGGNDRNSRGSGRTGNSARTAQISAPMMAENSLGWN